ncbi:MFS transporter [Streptomyces sp. NPDC091267]|uniref:MFS transporter n=1 Tax=unclassified Streptomyces TaxID=2593676 RepID=UPI00342BCBBE
MEKTGTAEHPGGIRGVLRPGPLRTLVAAVGADSVGQGLLISVTTFYMLRVVGLSAAQVGTGLTVAAVLGILVSAPVGYAADRSNPLTLTVLATALQGAAVLGYLLVGGMAAYMVMTALYAVTAAAGAVTGAAMLPTVMPAAHRVRTRATTRVTSNIGITFGVALGGVAVGLGSATAYRALLVVTACGLCLSAFAFSRLRRYQTGAAAAAATPQETVAASVEEPSHPGVLRDRPYLAVTVVGALLAINDGLLTVALPLWISQSTDAPLWLYSVAVIVNTAGVVLFQIPLSRSCETVPGAARALRVSGAALAAACVLWGAASLTGTRWVAAVLILVGAAVHVVGELTSSAGGWGLSYELAPEHAHGRYQGVFGTGQQMTNAVVPFVAGVLLIQHGLTGWCVVAAVLLAAGLLAPAVTRWAQRTPPRTTAAAEGTGPADRLPAPAE